MSRPLSAWLQSHRSEALGPSRRIYFVRLVISLGTLTGMALSPKLWTNDRAFPPAPIVDALGAAPNALHVALSVAFGVLLASAALFPRSKRFPLLAALAGLTLVALDQNRLQPWFYQFLAMLAAIGLTRDDEREGPWPALALIVACIYLWSGIQKANMAFVNDVFPSLSAPISEGVFGISRESLRPLGFVVPFLEAGLGVALLFPGSRTLGVLAALGMHAFVFAAIGPLGHDYNRVVWPWNLAMAALAAVLFFRNQQPLLPVLRRAGARTAKAAAVLFGVVPSLNYAGLWDDYLSASLYSGLTKDGGFLLSEDAVLKLPDSFMQYLKPHSPGYHTLDVTLWAFEELGVPPYPERRIYAAIERGLCAYGIEPGGMTLYWRGRADLATGKRKTIKIRCCE